MSKNITIILNVIIAIFEIIGTTIGMVNNGVLGDIVYYTVLSNILAFFTSSALVINTMVRKTDTVPFVLQFLRLCTATCLTVTFLIVMLVLVPMSIPYGTYDQILYKGANLWHHLLCPILTIISFVFLEENTLLRYKHALAAATPTLAYAIVLSLLNTLLLVYGPYPFLLVYEQPWYASVLWFVGIVGLSAAVACLLLKVKRH